MSDFAVRLLGWYDRHKRALPWRDRDDPWLTWVSEVMLQQTRVEAVLAAFERFAARYPTPAALADAADDELQAAWRGLGYYRRARMLRDGARQVVARHGGRVPSDPEALGRLAGIGDYSRGAIASIAFGHVLPAVDGNVERVVARHRALTADVKTAPARRAIRAQVIAWIDEGRPGDFNQALMDLGATVCTPRNPRCGLCPVATDCEGRIRGIAADLPNLPPRRAAVPVTARAVLVRDRAGRALAHRLDAGAINAGQIELPGPGILVDHPEAGDGLAASLRARFGARFTIGAPIATIRHGITHHRITFVVHAAELVGRPPAVLSFHGVDDDAVPWSTASRKALARAR